MQFSIATIIAASAAFVAASPCSAPATDDTIKAGDRFTIMALRSASRIHFAAVSASQSSLKIGVDQDASCGEKVDYATFSLNEAGDLYLNTANPPQQIYVDRSGMGQGIISYTTGVQPIGKNQERGPFAIKDGNLVFNNGRTVGSNTTGFTACPIASGGYSVWLDDVASPRGQTGCLEFSARAVKVTGTPQECAYSTTS